MSDLTFSNDKNPWAGLASYQDPEISGEQLKFCGRDNESFDVAQLIDNNIFVTLYGKSGTGKTSLLNAGVFPRLRKDCYFPISIRLGMEAIDTTFQQCLIEKINQALKGKGRTKTCNVVSMPEDEEDLKYLWSFFARTQFLDNDGNVVFPVVVFDQFEEVFRNRREETEALLRQIHFMMDESHTLSDRTVDGEPYSYDYNFRFVVSIREDDLYRLEDSIDNNYLLSMKHCRYRLRNFSEQGAKDVIFIPGGDLFLEDEKDKIADTIIEIARNKEDKSVSANILSLICSRIYVEHKRTGNSKISLSLVDKFVKGNPFERFYNEATQGFSNREKAFIETNMVDSSGRRNSVAESDFLLHVNKGAILFDGERKILQRISTSSDGGNYRVELIHDSFCEPLAGLKEKREKKRRMKWIASGAVLALVAIGIISFLTYQSLENRRLIAELKQSNVKNEKLLAENKQTISEKEKINAKNLILMAEKDSTNEENELLIEQLNDKNKDVEKKNLELQNKNVELQNKNIKLEYQENQIKEGKNREKELWARIENPNQKEQEVEDVGLLQYDGINYYSPTPTEQEIEYWKNSNKKLCSSKIKNMGNGYDIPLTMKKNDPCLVYLVLNSKSINEQNERQNWFDLYSLMNEEQIDRLYDILYRERYKLAQIENKYERRKNELDEKYGDFDNYLKGKTPNELNQIAYDQADLKEWKNAHKAIDKAIELDPQEANYYDSKGEILLKEDGEKYLGEALRLWKKAIQLNPNFLDEHPKSNLYKELKKKGLVK